MIRAKWLLIVFGMLASPSLAGAATYVLGDSIGDGVATTLGMQNLAQIGIHIRGPKALAQIERTPPGSTIFIFLGTNDAEGSIKNIEKSIADIVAAADRKRLTVIWLGPHCVRKGWDSRARELDEILRRQLAGTSVKYVSMREPRLCSGSFHEPDGVHLTAKGYRYMWERVRAAVDTTATKVASALAPAETTTAIPQQLRAADGGLPRRLVMDIHVPASSGPLVWTRGSN